MGQKGRSEVSILDLRLYGPDLLDAATKLTLIDPCEAADANTSRRLHVMLSWGWDDGHAGRTAAVYP